jgi:predicted PhzF superfamily epimerase YddE/YHI9
VNEDPVTGSVHTVLARYWSEQLKKKSLTAFQKSWRSGQLLLEVGDDAVEIRGKARVVLRGTFFF